MLNSHLRTYLPWVLVPMGGTTTKRFLGRVIRESALKTNPGGRSGWPYGVVSRLLTHSQVSASKHGAQMGG